MERKQVHVKDLRGGGFVIVDDVACKVEDVQVSKSGKHGAAKARVTATGVFDNQKRVFVKPADSAIDVPIIEKKAMQVIAIMGDNVQLMDLQDYTNRQVPIPEEFRGKLVEGEEVLVWTFGASLLLKGKKS